MSVVATFLVTMCALSLTPMEQAWEGAVLSSDKSYLDNAILAVDLSMRLDQPSPTATFDVVRAKGKFILNAALRTSKGEMLREATFFDGDRSFRIPEARGNPVEVFPENEVVNAHPGHTHLHLPDLLNALGYPPNGAINSIAIPADYDLERGVLTCRLKDSPSSLLPLHNETGPQWCHAPHAYGIYPRRYPESELGVRLWQRGVGRNPQHTRYGYLSRPQAIGYRGGAVGQNLPLAKSGSA